VKLNAANDCVDARASIAFCAGVNALDYAKFRSRSHHAVIRVYDEANVIEAHEHKGDFKVVVTRQLY
jgi:hypothetical protein